MKRDARQYAISSMRPICEKLRGKSISEAGGHDEEMKQFFKEYYKYENDIEPENLLYLKKDKAKAITEREEVYILSNEQFFMAAGVLADSEIMHQISDIIEDDYYILPVCQHEPLIVSKRKCSKTVQELQAELKDINEHEWEPEEILSECIMVYQRSRRRIGTIYPDQSMSYNLMPDFIRSTRRKSIVCNRMAQG